MTDFEKILEYEADSHPTIDERAVIADYKKAINENITDRLNLYNGFGPTIRHRVMNMNSYSHALKFGYADTSLDNYNWLTRPVWEIERIEFQTTLINNNPYVELGKGPNGKYSWGYSFNYGSAGGGLGIGVYRSPIDTRDEAFNIAMAFAKKEYTNAINRNDSTNFKDAAVKQVLASIEIILNNTKQLQLF
jgi:hypothetical protein